MATTKQAAKGFAYLDVVDEICAMNWARLGEHEVVAAAWAYYFFSIQFRENLEIARAMFPGDAKLADLETEECDTANLSPWPGVAASGEKLNHDEFMRRVLHLSPPSQAMRARYDEEGERYLDATRRADDITRALSLASYEDGGLEAVFRAMLTSPGSVHPVVAGFRHFLSEHIRFDSDPEGGHGAMIRHLRPDDRILPLWSGFRDLLLAFVPGLARRAAAA